MPAPIQNPDPSEVVRAVTLLVWLTGILAVFVAMVAYITLKRRTRLRRERVAPPQPTRFTDAWAEAGRRMAVAPSKRLPGDGPPPLDDDDDPSAKTRGPDQ